MSSIKQSILVRVQLVFWIVVVAGVIVIGRIAYLQTLEGGKWRQVAKEIGLQYRVKKATRGNIYGTDGVLLATSIPLYKLSMDPTVIDEETYRKGIEPLSEKLADFFQDLPAREYLIKINEARRQKKRYLIINRKLITYLDKKMMETWPIFQKGQLQGGVIFEKIEERTYPFKELAARTIGFVNENKEGAGLELTYNKVLRGIDGKALYQKIAGGEWKPIRSGSRIRPEEGLDVYTTIDINVQDVAHKALEEALIRNDAEYGCVVVMEVATGEIKAMVNLGKTEPGKYLENYNYAIGDVGSTDPGSTFKVASMAALLEDSTLTLQDSIETGGGQFSYFDRVMKDTKWGGWGKITIEDALVVSSNIGVSRLISRQFGRKPEKYIEYLEKFQLTQPLRNIQIKGVADPYIKTPKDQTWSGVTLPWMSVGYESKISPLQLLAFYNALANDGYYISPIIVREVRKTNKTIEKFKPWRNKQKICSDKTRKSLHKMLKGVVERGTAKNIYTKKYEIAGKTGTSQKLNRRGRYIKKYKTSFAGYFPADNPKYSCIVVIDEPKGSGQYGGDVSAPVFRKIADRLYAIDIDIQNKEELQRETKLYKVNLPARNVGNIQDVQDICETLSIPNVNKSKSEWVVPIANKYSVEWQDRRINENSVPNVKGLTLKDALFILENKGLKVYYSGRGRVKTQSLMPGDPLRKGEKIVISLQ